MYERPDVPKDNPHRNLIALIVLAVVAVAMAMLVSSLWKLANTNSAMGSKTLAKAVKSTKPSSDTIGAYAEATGLTATGAGVETVLFVITPDSSDESASAVYLAVMNETEGSTKLVQFQNDAWVQAGDENYTVTDWYAQQGASGLASAISACAAVPVNHIVVMQESGWNSLMTVAKEGTSSLASKSTELVEAIEETDMDVSDLVDVAQKAISAGASVDEIETVAMSETSDDAGNTRMQVDATQLAVTVGTLA